MKIKQLSIVALTFIVMIISSSIVFAQDDPSLPDVDPDNPVPVDGGVGFLVAAGVAYGLKKVYEKRKEAKR